MVLAQQVAVVGSSGHAARVAAPTVAAAEGAALAGVLGSTPEKSRALAGAYPGAKAFASWDELLEAADAVWIAGPNHSHAAFAERCLRAGRHVLLEKPMATTHADAERLAAVAREQPALLAVGFQHRFRAAHRWLREALRDGLVGEVRTLRIHRFWPYPYFDDMPAESWRTSPEASGGWATNDIGAHSIDLACWLLGERPRLVYAHTANHRFRDVAVEDSALLVLETDGGAVITIETSNAMASFPGTIEVHGLDGWARADGTFDAGGTVACHDARTREFPPVDAYAAAFADFLAATGGAPSGNASPEEAAHDVAIVERAILGHQSIHPSGGDL